MSDGRGLLAPAVFPGGLFTEAAMPGQLYQGDESMRLRHGEFLPESLCMIKRHGVRGILLKNLIKLHEGFRIISFVFQRDAQI